MPLPRSDIPVLFLTRTLRLFAYGLLSVVLALYLAEIGLGEDAIGLLFTATLAGDAVISLWVTTSADRIGRRKMLVLGSALMVAAGTAFLLTSNPVLLMIAGIIGVISPSGNEIGPFLSIEQAALSQLAPASQRTHLFSRYALLGSLATALGALGAGWLTHTMRAYGYSPVTSYRAVLYAYAASGMVLALSFLSLSPSVETSAAAHIVRPALGLHRSRMLVMKLSSLFALDAFGGGFVVQSLVAYWFHVKFGVDAGDLGFIFFGANILAGFSALLAAHLASRIGLVRTMVFTHIPSNLLLCLVPFMPNVQLAAGVLLLRFSISQMDVPTRQSYTMAVVAPDERSAASGVTSMARSVGASISPAIAGLFLARPVLMGVPFVIAGSLKIIYDIVLYGNFRSLKPPEESPCAPGAREGGS